MTSPPSTSAAVQSRCARCGTELPPEVLSCPACRALVHAERLRSLAADADAHAAAGRLLDARSTWEMALALLPGDSNQHVAVATRIAEITRQIDALPAAERPSATGDGTWWKRGGAIAVALVLLLASKLKFLLLGLTKASTFFSMFAFFGVYWSLYGWPLALGLVVSIYIHEMGHVYVLRRLGIGAGAPLFVPGVGAFVLLKQRVEDPRTDARIGLAGPIWGLGAGLVAIAAYATTGAPIYSAIAQLTGFINLFNLIPVWQLDGARGFHALDRTQRWLVVIALATAFALSGQRMLLIVGAVAVYRAFQRESGPGDLRSLATFVLLVAGLAWLSHPMR